MALDIDGTVADEGHVMPPEVEQYLAEQHQLGWTVVFITGRTFAFGHQVLQACTFPYYFAMFNGAQLIRMPEGDLVRLHEAQAEFVRPIVKACEAEDLDPQFHSRDGATWRPHRLQERERHYLEERMVRSNEDWDAVEEFVDEPFLYAKVFGQRGQLEGVAERLQGAPLAANVIQDPLRMTHAVMLITAEAATKGGVVRDMRVLAGADVPVIAAGDDFNDLSMFAEADVSVAMPRAPQAVRAAADIVAPLIEGLERAQAEWID